MNKFLLFVILFHISLLFSVSEYACYFTLENVSARDAAFGIESGVAGLKFNSVLSSMNNPAKLGALDGISLGDFRYKHKLSDYYSRQIAIGFAGIGLSMPVCNEDDKIGNTINYGEQTATGEQGEYIDKFESYETVRSYNIGIDLSRVYSILRNGTNKNIHERHFSFLIGYSYNIVNSKLVPKDVLEELIQTKVNLETASYSNFGLLVSYIPEKLQSRARKLKFTFGANFINFEQNTIKYIGPNEPLPDGLKLGLSANYSIPLNWFLDRYPGAKSYSLDYFTANFLSLYTSYDLGHYADKYDKFEFSRTIHGCGAEVSLFDIISYRIGYTNNTDSEQTGLSYSYGVNLSYLNLVTFQYNYTEMFEDSEIYSPERYDFQFNINLYEMIVR